MLLFCKMFLDYFLFQVSLVMVLLSYCCFLVHTESGCPCYNSSNIFKSLFWVFTKRLSYLLLLPHSHSFWLFGFYSSVFSIFLLLCSAFCAALLTELPSYLVFLCFYFMLLPRCTAFFLLSHLISFLSPDLFFSSLLHYLLLIQYCFLLLLPCWFCSLLW